MHVDEQTGDEDLSRQMLKICGVLEGKLSALYWEYLDVSEDVNLRIIYTMTDAINREAKEFQVHWEGQLKQQIKSEGALREKKDRIDRDE